MTNHFQEERREKKERMWEQEEFEKHWRNEFPDGEVPRMNLCTVEDIENELELCKARLKSLQQELAMEKFKVIYLQTTIAQKRKSYDADRWGSKEHDAEDAATTKPERSEQEGVRAPPGIRLHALGSRSMEEPCGALVRGSKTGKPILVPPRKKSALVKENVAGSGCVHLQDECDRRRRDSERDSDRDYDDVELNENFVRKNLIDPKAKESRQSSLRPFSKDFDFGDDGRLSPCMPLRGSVGSGRSTPDRRSDGYLSSEHEDSSSVDNGISILTRISDPLEVHLKKKLQTLQLYLTRESPSPNAK
ncbi:active breakpoint cluster region-related protein isoform X1 [Silurus meridionalis]|nr:active breakpoint cluster region-related protein isoform X1 [Silurus meridionalis]